MSKKKILCIDAFNIMMGQNAVSNIMDHNAQPAGMYLTTLNQVRNFIDKLKPSKVFFVLDGPQAGQRRRNLYPGYKGKRRVKPKRSKVKFQTGDEEEIVFEIDGGFERQMVKIYDFLKLLPVTTCIIPYIECDDVIANIALKNQEEYDIYIISTDKDYLQLVNENIKVYNWRKKKIYNKEEFLEEHKLLPKNYIYKKIIRGDNSDEIKGVKAIGEKTFERIFCPELSINENINNLGDFLDFIKQVDKTKLEKKDVKHFDLLQESLTQKDLILKFQLMKLSSDYMSYKHLDLLRAQIEEQQSKTFSKVSAIVQMLNDGFNKIYGPDAARFNANSWLQPFHFLDNSLKINI